MARFRPTVPPLVPGIVCSAAGLALLASSRLVLAALGTEALAMGFWLWARQAADRREQLTRWAWLRRPATALWLAAALTAALPPAHAVPGAAASAAAPVFAAAPAAGAHDPLGPARALRSLAVLWAALELLGALPLSRPFPDLPGPVAVAGPWLPAVLPAAGFLLLWRQSPAWSDAPLVRELAAVALLYAAALAVMRAGTRNAWTATLRWLVVFDSALAGMLIALGVIRAEAAVLLWCAAAGGRLVALAAELHGATGRRGPSLTRLWRAAGWTAGASLSWALLAGVGLAGGRVRPVEFTVIALPVAVSARISTRRMHEAPERRALARPDAARVGSFAAALGVLVLGPVALLYAWWSGFEVSFPGGAVALLPALVGAWPAPSRPAAAALPPVLRAGVAAGASARDFSRAVYRSVTSFERRLAAAMGALLRALGAPARDLHSGDAQEYLLFLIGVSVLALLLPLLRR